MIEIELANRQEQLPVPQAEICKFVQQLLGSEGVHSGALSLAVVEDLEMRELHCRFLGDDSTTDVLSFPLNDDCSRFLDGEVVVNAQQAIREGTRLGCDPMDELLLYIVHGVLHLCGYDDRSEQDAAVMRARQSTVLAGWGIHPIDEPPAPDRTRRPAP